MKKILAILLTVLLLVQPISLSVSAFDFNDGTLTWPDVCTKHEYDNACDPTCNKCGMGRTPADHVYDNACDAACNVCGATRTPAAHVYDNACDAACNVCGATRAVEHHYTAVVIPPNCEDKGYTIYTCAVCGDSYTDAETPATGHVYDTEVVPPTCVDNGYTAYICRVCGDRFTINTPAVGHSYTTTVVDPRCDEEGYDLHTCTVCGDSYKDNFTPMRTEHGYIMGDEYLSCTEPCYIDYFCIYCGDTYREYSDPTGHSPWVYPTIWLCQQYTYCQNPWCYEILIPATGHIHSELVEHKDPTCDQEGYDRYCCYGCPNYKTETIPATGHTYTDACDTDCDVCGDTRTPPHQYTDPYDPDCDLCGAVRAVNEFKKGDVNGDGKINVRDLGLLQQKLNGWDVDVSMEAADVTGDGKVNVRDLGKLQQYLNGWDVEIV